MKAVWRRKKQKGKKKGENESKDKVENKAEDKTTLLSVVKKQKPRSYR
ncbi:hypothetical protein [Actinobacillus pleuropneumoniae]|nr:hypothetical protein [Actinobacillus pleuropneumoniae]